MDWDDAIYEAKEELGYYDDEYIKDWDEVVETAHLIIDQQNKDDYKNYLKSERWQILRLKALQRDNFTCQKCKTKATEVHHLNYQYIKTPKELEFLVSLCHDCHQKETFSF